MTAHTRPLPLGIAVLIAFAWSGPALAQTRLYLLTAGVPAAECDWAPCEPGRVTQIDGDRPEILASTSVGGSRTRVIGPRVTADGKTLLWSGSDGITAQHTTFVSLFDLPTRRQTTFTPGPTSDFVPVRVHPTEIRAFIQPGYGAQVIVAEPGGTKLLPQPCGGGSWLGDRSGDGRRLALSCGDEVVVVDSRDGLVIARVPEVYGAHRLNQSGTELVAAYLDYWGEYPPEYQRRDVATGATLAWRVAPWDEFEGYFVVYDPRTARLYLGSQGGVVIIDAATLQPVGRIQKLATREAAAVVVDPDRPLAYVAWQSRVGPKQTIVVTAFDTTTLATVGSMELPLSADVLGMALGPRPPATAALSAGVAGATVTLSWATAAGGAIATGHVVEAGFTSGQTVVRLPVSAGATSLLVPGVPPGRYFVRVRSVNGTGLGAPSNEVLVNVP
jgi:hypothetical protein